MLTTQSRRTVRPFEADTVTLCVHNTAITRYNAVRLALIRYYAAIAFQPFLDRAHSPPTVTLFVSTVI
jgi:hypothetical protein